MSGPVGGSRVKQQVGPPHFHVPIGHLNRSFITQLVQSAPAKLN